MALRLRRGTNSQRLLITPLQGELIYTTDTKQLFVGDGSTVGGTAVDTGAVAFAGISADVTPDADNTRDIGAVGNRWAEGRFVNIFGALTGSVTGNLTGNVTGNLSGNVTGNLTGNVTGNVAGNVDGDLEGSVFADDSTAIVDAIQKRILADVYSSAGTLLLSTNPATNVVSNGDIVITDNVITLLNGLDTIQFGTNNSALGVSLRLKNSFLGNSSLEVEATTNGTDTDSFEFSVSRGTLSVPTILNAGDPIYKLAFRGYDGATNALSAFIAASVDPAATPAAGVMPGVLAFGVTSDNGVTLRELILTSSGGFNLVSLTTAERNAMLTVLDGQMIYNETDNKFQGRANGVWVDLH
jgi:hypothetical protein